jgi:hypothetical protein
MFQPCFASASCGTGRNEPNALALLHAELLCRLADDIVYRNTRRLSLMRTRARALPPPVQFGSASATTSAASLAVPTVNAMYCLPFAM